MLANGRFIIRIGLILSLVSGAASAQWQWPPQMNIAGFAITDIRGSTGPDGSGTAAGTLQVPGLAAQKISLNRTPNGVITGVANVAARLSGADLQGRLSLTEAGLDGRGIIQTTPRPVAEAQFAIDARGRIAGSGRVALGAMHAPVKFSTSSGAFDLTGSAAAQAAADTPLANYRFEGRIDLAAGAGRILATASGEIKRTGKLANQVTLHQVQGAAVNLIDGSSTMNAGGVNVAFKLF